jgi:phosphopentomutase
MQRRAFVVVIDACGAGELPDAAEYGDAGANTLLHVAQAVGGLDLPTLGELGLGNIIALPGVPPSPTPVMHGRLHPLGPGKDSSSGHWELMGVVVGHAPPTYPDGLPAALLARVEATARSTSSAGARSSTPLPIRSCSSPRTPRCSAPRSSTPHARRSAPRCRAPMPSGG